MKLPSFIYMTIGGLLPALIIGAITGGAERSMMERAIEVREAKGEANHQGIIWINKEYGTLILGK